jgi:xanthine/CO dehydrogenase XdhC/CoxF family maturation factor
VARGVNALPFPVDRPDIQYYAAVRGQRRAADSKGVLAMSDMLGHEDVLATANDWLEGGRQVAVATVIETWGSSPRPAGSQLAIDSDGHFVGSVSGGCIEGAVVREALEVIESGAPRILDFGVSDEQAWDVGLACGGKVQVFVERMDRDD